MSAASQTLLLNISILLFSLLVWMISWSLMCTDTKSHWVSRPQLSKSRGESYGTYFFLNWWIYYNFWTCKTNALLLYRQNFQTFFKNLNVFFALIAGSGAVDGINVNADKKPEFQAPISNISVIIGREAVLTCSVTDLGNYKVSLTLAACENFIRLLSRVRLLSDGARNRP